MPFTLQAFKEDALASDMTDSASSLTLVAGAFGTPTGEQMLVIDPDIAAKREIVKCAIDGATVTSVDRAQDGTSAVAHSSGAKVIMAFVPSHYTNIFERIYPIGSIYTNASDDTNPADLLGFGTWEAFGAGRVMVGVDAGQAEFDTLGKTGGAKTHTLSIDEMPAHTHELYGKSTGNAGSNDRTPVNIGDSPNSNTGSGSSGGGGAHNNLQPYITVYMWKRTA